MRWSLLDIALLMLASYRLTHVVVFDRIAEPLRDLFPGHGWLAYLIRCYWCAGVWISALLVTLLILWPRVGWWVVAVLAVAGGQAFLETVLRRRDKPKN